MTITSEQLTEMGRQAMPWDEHYEALFDIANKLLSALTAQQGEAVAPQDRLSRHADIILDAINEYDGWLEDDDYDAQGCLKKIMERMKSRFDLASPVGSLGSDDRQALPQGERKGRQQVAMVRTSIRDIALRAIRRMRQSGESHEMCARWIAEGVDKVLTSAAPQSPARDTAGEDTLRRVRECLEAIQLSARNNIKEHGQKTNLELAEVALSILTAPQNPTVSVSPTPIDWTKVDAAIGGSYELPDGRKFWMDYVAVQAIIARLRTALQPGER